MSKCPKHFSKYLGKSPKNKPILNPLVLNFPQQELKSMSEIVYTGNMEIKQLSKQHGWKVLSGKPLN